MAERPIPRPDVRRAFVEAATELELETVVPAVEARCVGVAFAIFQPTVDEDLADPAAPTAPTPPPPGSGDATQEASGAAIQPLVQTTEATAPASAEGTATAAPEQAVRDHLQRWESLTPEQFAASWRELATDPYVGVGPGWVGTIDGKTVEQWMQSPDLREAMEIHPPYSPRRVTLSNLQLTWLGAARVVATYNAEETYTNGKVAAGNTFAVLMHVRDGGWRIAVASKGTRHEATLRG